MKFRVLFSLLAALALPLSVLAAEEAPTDPPKKSLWSRLNPFGSKEKSSKDKSTNFKQLEMGLLVDPNPVKLGDNRLIKVTLTLTNRGGKMAQLEFPTSQRVEVLLKGKAGQTIEQWSQDQAFDNEPTLVTINPKERLEYTVSVATREMVAGETYTVEAFFPNFEALRKTLSISATK
jgi:hypothetical protein